MSGYISSGRFIADAHYDSAMNWKRHAEWCFRVGMAWHGKRAMRDAIREWKLFRHYRERIAA